MARIQTTQYSADIDTLFQWATVDGDMFDRELDLSFLARALERHDHSAGRGIAVGRVASGSIGTAAFAAGAVDTAALGALQVTGPKIAAQAVDATKLAVGAALANLGFTPVNKAGDTMTGNLIISGDTKGLILPGGGHIIDVIANGTYLRANQNVFAIDREDATQAMATFTPTLLTLLGGLTAGAGATFPGDILAYRSGSPTTGAIFLGNNSGNTYIFYDGTHFQFAAINSGQIFRSGQRVWDSGNDGAGSGLDADLLDGQDGAHYATAASVAALVGVPLNGVIMFKTSGQLTAAGANWQADTAFNGRLPVGVGTSFGQTFAESGSYGSNWTPVTGLSSASTGVPSETFPVSNGATQVASAGHTHGGGAINGQGSVWHPPMFGVVFGRRIS